MLRQLTTGILFWATALAGAVAQDKPDPELALYFEGNRLYNIKTYPLAAEKFKEFIRTKSNHAKAPNAKYGLGLSLYADEKFAEAEKVFAELAKNSKSPEPEQVILLQGQCLLTLDRQAEAIVVFTAGSKRGGGSNPFKAQCFAGLAEAQAREKKWEEVVKAGDQFLKLLSDAANPLVGRTRFHLGTAHRELKQFEESAKVIEQLLATTGGPDKTPFGQAALFILADSRRELGNAAEAIKYYELARKREGPLASDALFLLGFVHFQERRFDNAIAALEALPREKPDSPLLEPARLILGRCYFEKKDFRRADATHQTLPNSAEAAFWRARAIEQDTRIDEAIAVLAAAVGKFPQDPLLPDLLFAHASVLMLKEDFAKAEPVLARLVSTFATWKNALDAERLQAFCLHRNAKYQPSLASCDRFLAKAKALTGKPEAPESLPNHIAETTFLRAENLLLLEKPAEAEPAFAQFSATFKTHPQVPAAQFRIGEIRYRKEDWKGAGEILRPIDPTKVLDPALVTQLDYMIGECALQLGTDDAGAERYFAKFITEKLIETPNRDAALLKLALLMQKRKDPVKAAAEYTRLLGEYPASVQRPRALLERGLIEYEANNYAAARVSFQEIITKHAAHPYRSHAVYRLGWVSLKDKKAPEARGHFLFVTTAKTAPELIADSHFQIALIGIEGKVFPEARQHLEKLVAGAPAAAVAGVTEPQLDTVLYYLGYVQSQMEDWPAAAISLARVIKEFPKSPWSENALYELAWCEESRAKPPEAIKRYTELLAKHTDGALAGSAAVKLAELQYAAEDIDGAIRVLGARIPILRTQSPELAARAAFRLGWCQYKKELYLESAKSFEEVLKNQAADPAIVPTSAYQAAEARLQLKEFAAAAVHYDRAIKATGAADDIREQGTLRLGECYGLTSRWPDSERAFREFAQRFGQSQFLRRSQLGLGWALENQKRYPEAVTEYQKAVSATAKEPPKDEAAARSQFQIGECFIAQKDFDRAISELIKVELHYGFPQWSSKAVLETGNALVAKGDKASAIERFQEVITRYPGTDEATLAKQYIDKNK
jgi:TolA-binding protein